MTLYAKILLGTAFYLHLIPTSSQCLVWLFMKTFVLSVYSRYPLQRVYKAVFFPYETVLSTFHHLHHSKSEYLFLLDTNT